MLKKLSAKQVDLRRTGDLLCIFLFKGVHNTHNLTHMNLWANEITTTRNEYQIGFQVIFSTNFTHDGK